MRIPNFFLKRSIWIFLSSFVLAALLTLACVTLVVLATPMQKMQNRAFIYSFYRDYLDTKSSPTQGLEEIAQWTYSQLCHLEFWYWSPSQNFAANDKDSVPVEVQDFIRGLSLDKKSATFGSVAGPFGHFFVIFKLNHFPGYLIIKEPKTGMQYLIRQHASKVAYEIVFFAIFTSLFLIFVVLQKQSNQFHELLDLLSSGQKIGNPLRNNLGRFISFGRPFTLIEDRILALVNSLKKSELQKSAFIEQIAHDLRTPLTSLSTSAETLALSPQLDPESLKALKDIIQDDVHFMNRLTENLLGISNLENLLVDLKPVKIGGVVQEVVERFRNLEHIQTRQIECLFENKNESEILIQADETQIRRLFFNLIDNATDFARSQIKCAVALETGRVKIMVSDDGPGLSSEAKAQYGKRATTRFRPSLHRDRQRTSLGLGSVIICETVRMFKGEIELSESTDGGLLVVIYFPVLS